MASTSDCSCLRPYLLVSFFVAVGRSTVQHSGLDGRVHCNDGEISSGLIQLGLMGVGASICVDA